MRRILTKKSYRRIHKYLFSITTGDLRSIDIHLGLLKTTVGYKYRCRKRYNAGDVFLVSEGNKKYFVVIFHAQRERYSEYNFMVELTENGFRQLQSMAVENKL